MAGTVENLPISTWLSELHMECYKKNLEDYDTIRPLLDLKELDLKKLGIQNSKDRARMLNSLANYKSDREDTTPTPCKVTPVQAVQEQHKSVLRKSSLKKINLKGLLSSGGSKKSKKSTSKTEVTVISSPSLPSTIELDQISTPIHREAPAVQSPKRMYTSSTTADYEELSDTLPPRSMTMIGSTKPFYPGTRKAIENEYVPSPENSPRFDAHRMRAHTMGAWDGGNFVGHTPQGGVSSSTTSLLSASSSHSVGVAQPLTSQNSTPEVRYRQQSQTAAQQPQNLVPSDEGSSSPGLKNRHLSAISMESGLSFGYDVEKDFNPSFPLENQPWYHGRISRMDAEGLLHDDGDFLVRENIKMPNTHTLSLCWGGKPDHTLIGATEVVSTTDLARATGYKYHFDGGAFDTIPELIYNHLKYQIPVDKTQHTLILNPICRPGLANKSTAAGGGHGIYMTMMSTPNYSTIPAHVPAHVPISPSTVESISTLPRNFGSNTKLTSYAKKPGSTSPENRLQLGPRVNFSPHHSARSTPSSELKSYGSSGDLLDATSSVKEDIEVQLRNVISPPPVGGGAGGGVRERAMTVGYHPRLRRSSSSISDSNPLSFTGNTSSDDAEFEMLQRQKQKMVAGASPCHKKMDSFGDYEVMESVSILNGSTGQFAQNPPDIPHDCTSLDTASRGAVGVPPRERVKYAEIHYPRNANGSKGGPVFVHDSKSVKYAEIRFGNKDGNVAGADVQAAAPHPFSLYDTVPPPRKQNSPYQSRAELLAQKMGDYAVPNPAAGKRQKPARSDSSPHPFSQQHNTASLPRTASSNYVEVSFGTPRNPPSSRSQAQQPSNVMYAILDKARKKKDRDSTASNDSALSTSSAHSSSPAPSSSSRHASQRNSPQPRSLQQQQSSPLHHNQHHQHHQRQPQHKPLANVHSHVPEAKVHKSLPGYAMLVKIHTLLQNHSNEELVYHLTRADATCFMLAPRPGEDTIVWKERVRQCTSSSGHYCGLQTLADPDGEKLWKKLYFRHLNLAQTVSLCIVTAGDAMERARLLHRFIEIASLLQSGSYGNLFSFIAVMQGLAVPPIAGMTDVWDLLAQHFPDAVSTHKDLMGVISNVKNGVAMYSTDQLTIPAIQHLKAVYHFSEQPIPGFPIAEEDLSMLGEYSSLCTGLDGVRTIVANTALFTYNTRKRLDGLCYDANLMDFFIQDTIRLYLQSISVNVDDPIERRRRFGVLLEALVTRVNSSEAV